MAEAEIRRGGTAMGFPGFAAVARRGISIGRLSAGVLGAVLLSFVLLGCGGSNGESATLLGFGTGGSNCSLATTGSTFARGAPVRMTVAFAPPLAKGGTVQITVRQNGTVLHSFDGTIAMNPGDGCLSGDLSPLDPGHYEVEAALSNSQMPPVTGTFDITP